MFFPETPKFESLSIPVSRKNGLSAFPSANGITANKTAAKDKERICHLHDKSDSRRKQPSRPFRFSAPGDKQHMSLPGMRSTLLSERLFEPNAFQRMIW